MKKIVKPQPISGFPELLPEEELLFQDVLNVIKEEYSMNGFLPIETASVERNEILMAKGGINTKEIYQLGKLGRDDEKKEFSLRFDLTVPFARYTTQNLGKLVFPFKRQQIQKVWRGERPGKGRFREFYQADIDIIGETELSMSYDAELLSIIFNIFTKLNIGGFKIRVNNRKLQKGLIDEYKLPIDNRLKKLVNLLKDCTQESPYNPETYLKSKLEKSFSLDKRETEMVYNWINFKNEKIEFLFKEFEEERIIKCLDDIDKVHRNQLFERLTKKLEVPEEYANKLLNFALSAKIITEEKELFEFIKKYSNNRIYQQGIIELENLLDEAYLLGVKKENISFDPKIARGLNYYTGVIYETDLEKDPHLGSICSGGRYENLLGSFSKNKLPGVGISIGVSRLMSSILDNKLLDMPSQKNATILVLTSKDKKKMLPLSKVIKNLGISCELSFLNVNKEYTYAIKKGFRFLLLSGEGDSLILRDLTQKDRKNSDTTFNIDKISIVLNRII